MKSFHTLSCVILVFSLCLASSSVWAADPAVPSFLKTFCADCHNPVKMKGKVSLTPLIENPASADPSLLQAVLDVVTSREMPPEDEKQPPSEARAAFLAAGSPLMREVALNRAKEAELPGHGNLVPHAVLFTEPEVRRAATPSFSSDCAEAMLSSASGTFALSGQACINWRCDAIAPRKSLRANCALPIQYCAEGASGLFGYALTNAPNDAIAAPNRRSWLHDHDISSSIGRLHRVAGDFERIHRLFAQIGKAHGFIGANGKSALIEEAVCAGLR